MILRYLDPWGHCSIEAGTIRALSPNPTTETLVVHSPAVKGLCISLIVCNENLQ